MTEPVRMVIRMSQKVRVSAGFVGYHVGRCPKYLWPVLAGRVVSCCEELIRTKADEHDWPMVAAGIGHLLVNAHRGGSPSRVASQFMGFTSWRLRAELSHVRSRLRDLWFRSCFVATAGAMPGQIVRRHTGTRNGWRWREGRA